MIRHVSGCAGRSSATRSVTTALTSSTSGCTGGSLANSENARTRRSSDSISLTTICDGLIHERALGRRLPRLHLLDRQPDRRQRVLQLVRGLARQRLPARHLRQVDEPLAVLLELIGHVVERVDGPAHLVARRRAGFAPVSSRRDQSPPAKSVSAAVSCWIGRLTRWAMKTSGSSETSHAAPSSRAASA